jgi:glutathione S-transferase
MKLIATPASPFGRKVRIVLAEKRIACEFQVDSPSNPATRVGDYNPLGKIPVLVLDDATALFDSRVIVEYLDGLSPVSRMIPEPARERIAVRRWEALADGCTEAATAIVTEKRRPRAQQSSESLERQRLKIERGLAAMSAGLGSRAWCSGDHYNLSDVAAGCAFGVLDFRMPDLIAWRSRFPNLAALAAKLDERLSFRTTAPYLVAGINVDYVEPAAS